MRPYRLGQQERRRQVDCDDPIPVVLVEGLHRAGRIGGRGIHQHIDSPPLGLDARHSRLDRRGIGQIHRQGDRAATQLGDPSLCAHQVIRAARQ